MKKGFTVEEIINITSGELLCGDKSTLCESFIKDTRKIAGGETYLGIKGEKFDGNSFYREAFSKGANAVIIEKDYIKNKTIELADKPIIVVDNMINALKKLAEYKRAHSQAKFIGVTGSVGKTSTRDMLYSVISTNYKTLKTEGNFNNNIGLPLTLMRLANEEVAVIEMGMNHLGEIDYLTNITKPHISVITNVGTAHIGELGSRENILKAKLEIVNGMNDKGILVINNDNDLLHEYYLKNKKKIVTIGINNESDFMATDIEINENSSDFNIVYKDNKYKVYCPVPGKVFIYNSLVAFAVGILLNIEPDKIIEGIKNFHLTKNRMEFMNLPNITLINDAYNASVDSMKSSLEVLGKYNTRKVAVLGDMLELGKYSKELHESVGESAKDNNIDILITIGMEAHYIASSAINKGMDKNCVYEFNNLNDAYNKLINIVKENDVILFKASNGMNLKDLVDKVKEYYEK